MTGFSSRLLAAWAAAFLAGVPCGARADAPMPPPAPVQVASPHGTCLVRAEPSPARLTVRAASRPDHVLWTVAYWSPVLLVSDDCGVAGAGYDRGPLLALAEKDAGTPVMMFFRAGRPARTVRLGELYPDLSVLPRTASHWRWLDHADWSGQAWTVRTVDGRTLSFQP